MSKDYTIRALTEKDWELFSDIRLEALKHHPDAYASRYEDEAKYTQLEWQNWLTGKERCVFGAFVGKTIIGIVGIFPHRFEFPHLPDSEDLLGVMGAAYVRPNYRQQSVAEKLGQACVQWSSEFASWHKLVVAHAGGNRESQGMIERLGFKLLEIESGRPWHGGIKDQYWYGMALDRLRPQIVPLVSARKTPNA